MIEITIPKLGLTMETARLLDWSVSSGDRVDEGQTILVIETDKVTYEVPAPSSGIIHPVALQGKECTVEEVVGFIAENLLEYERIASAYPAAAPVDQSRSPLASPDDETAGDMGGDLQRETRLKASPLARAMAAEHGLELGSIQGSGPGGRIVREDILSALEMKTRPFPESPLSEDQTGPNEVREHIPITGARKIIFENMHASISRSAQLTIHTEASAVAIAGLRDRFGRSGEKISYNAILIKIAAAALELHPRINASVVEGAVIVWEQINIGLAMEAQDTLIVPVFRSPDIKRVTVIQREIDEALRKIEVNRLSPEDLSGGTFTLTNLGFWDVDHFTPIIRPPESAILGAGRIARKPTVKNDVLVPELRISLSLTFDHRIIDGAPAARFLKTIKDIIEDPLLMIG
jgi:pyruvate dehydrogenase E2 component (dihydrolipoamide acetyltransferase)